MIDPLPDHGSNSYNLFNEDDLDTPTNFETMSLKELNLQANIHCTPRELNSLADALSNLDWAGFDEQNRVAVDLAKVEWAVLDRAIARGEEYLSAPRQPRHQTARPARGGKRKGFRETDPW